MRVCYHYENFHYSKIKSATMPIIWPLKIISSFVGFNAFGVGLEILSILLLFMKSYNVIYI